MILPKVLLIFVNSLFFFVIYVDFNFLFLIFNSVLVALWYTYVVPTAPIIVPVVYNCSHPVNKK